MAPGGQGHGGEPPWWTRQRPSTGQRGGASGGLVRRCARQNGHGFQFFSESITPSTPSVTVFFASSNCLMYGSAALVCLSESNRSNASKTPVPYPKDTPALASKPTHSPADMQMALAFCATCISLLTTPGLIRVCALPGGIPSRKTENDRP